jgi:hypothetical protein
LAGDTGGKPSCRVYNSANLAIVTATLTVLTFDSERWDSGGLHSTSVNTGRITIPSGAAGKYIIGGAVNWASNATGIRTLQIRQNGTVTIAVNDVVALSANTLSMNVETIYPMVATDYLELIAYQTSGGNLNVQTLAQYSPEFWAMWVAL